MRRLIAIVLGCGLFSWAAQMPTLHTHEYDEYADHDHPEHHHGLAAHQHAGAPYSADEALRFEPCDPGRHMVSTVLFCGPPPHGHAVDARFVNAARPIDVLPLVGAAAVTDVRAHGPPLSAYASLRGPPARIPA